MIDNVLQYLTLSVPCYYFYDINLFSEVKCNAKFVNLLKENKKNKKMIHK